MDDQIALRLGAAPWEPATSAKEVKQLNYYDIPLAGILVQRRQYYLYECLIGQTDEHNLWAYLPITKREARKLRRLTGDKLTRCMESKYDRPFVVALALETEISAAVLVNVKAPAEVPALREDILLQALETIRKQITREGKAVGTLTPA
jgi:hypothetical protein